MIRELLQEKYDRHPLISTVVTGWGFALILTLILTVVTGGAAAYYSMFPDKNDIFMDYFHSVFYSIDNPYTEHSVIYPPLITVFYEIIGKLLYLGHISDGFDIRDSYTGMFSYMILVIISVLLLYKLLKRKEVGDHHFYEAFIILLFFSYPIVFTIMRGNCIVYALIFLELFLIGYRSENKVLRYLSYLSLACSAGLKAYTALFGLLVVRERNTKDILICVAMGAFVFLFPFVFTDGNLLLFLSNSTGLATGSTYAYPLVNIGDFVTLLWEYGVSMETITVITLILCTITYLVTAYIVIMKKNVKMWEMVMLLSTNVIIGFGVSTSYLFVFIIAAIPLFFREEREMTVTNTLVCIALIIVFMVAPAIGESYISRQFYITMRGIATLCLYITMVYVALRRKDGENGSKESVAESCQNE